MNKISDHFPNFHGNAHRVNMTYAYRTALQQLIEMRLGAPAFQLTKMRLTTNKNGAANWATSPSLPKKLKFYRNTHLCIVIDRMNYGAGVLLLPKLECSVSYHKRLCVAQAAKQI